MNRWVRLVGSVLAMAMIANFQYAWALFVKPMMGATGWKLSDVQWGFTLFIAFETWVQPFAGRFMDRMGPRLFMSAGGVMCAIGWVGMGRTHSLTGLYILYSLAGVGAVVGGWNFGAVSSGRSSKGAGRAGSWYDGEFELYVDRLNSSSSPVMPFLNS